MAAYDGDIDSTPGRGVLPKQPLNWTQDIGPGHMEMVGMLKRAYLTRVNGMGTVTSESPYRPTQRPK